MNTKTIAIAAVLTAFASAGAHAYQGEEGNLPPASFVSNASRAAVRAEALNPVRITNAGTGVMAPKGNADRASVQRDARAAASSAWLPNTL